MARAVFLAGALTLVFAGPLAAQETHDDHTTSHPNHVSILAAGLTAICTATIVTTRWVPSTSGGLATSSAWPS